MPDLGPWTLGWEARRYPFLPAKSKRPPQLQFHLGKRRTPDKVSLVTLARFPGLASPAKQMNKSDLRPGLTISRPKAKL